MTLRHLSVTQLRNLDHLSIELHPQLNVFYGNNGSGKTSILEAISCLSVARSFRTHKLKSLINHEAEAFTVFGRIEEKGITVPVGIHRNRVGDVDIKVSGDRISKVSELVSLLPARIMDSQAFLLLEGSPHVRRQMLDWLVFHVEHQFLSTWKTFEKSLKQRNSLLRRDKIDEFALASWDKGLAHAAEKLDQYRSATFTLLAEKFASLVADVPVIQEVTLDYYRGWPEEADYGDLLRETQNRDFELGYTRQGPQRADIRLKVGGTIAVDVLSRGQQKMVVSALLIAQGQVYTELCSKSCAYLIDDMPAELDEKFRSKLASWLEDMKAQVFVTGVFFRGSFILLESR